MSRTERYKGKVKWFNDQKGFGFVESPDLGCNVFVHFTEIKVEGFKSLVEGQEVEFEVFDAPKGPAARNLTVLPAA